MEQRVITLEVGENMLAVGANPSGIPAAIREGTETRCHNWVVSHLTQSTELPKGTRVVVVNGRIVENAIEKAKDLATDHGTPLTFIMVRDGGVLKEMLEQFPLGKKGVVSFEIPETARVEELGVPIPPAPNPADKSAPDSAPPAPPSPAPAPPPPPPGPTSGPTPRRMTVNEIRDRLESIFVQCGGDIGATIKRTRELGLSEETFPYQQVWGWVNTIRNRLKRQAHTTKDASAPNHTPPELGPELARKFLEAVEASRAADGVLFELFHEIAAENERLRALLDEQKSKLAGVPALEAEINRLRKKLEPFVRAAAQLSDEV